MKNKYIKIYINNFFKPFIGDQISAILFLTIYTIGTVAFPYFIKLIIDKGIEQNNIQNVFIYTSMMMLFLIIMLVFNYLNKMKFLQLGQKITYKIKHDILYKITNFSVNFLKQYQSGEIVSIIQDDVEQVENLMTNILSTLLSNIVTAVGLFIVLITIDFQIAIISVLLVSLYTIVQIKFGGIIQKKSIEFFTKRGKIYSNTQEFILGINDIKMLNCEKYFTNRYLEEHREYFDKEKKLVKSSVVSENISAAFNSMGMILALCLGGYKVLNNSMTIGTLFALIVYIQRIYTPIISLTSLYIEAMKTKANILRVLSLIENDKELIEDGDIVLENELNGEIQFNNVSFGYDKNILIEDINLKLDKGEKIALKGKNGAGKTSIIRLLMRMVKDYSGEILLDGENIKKYKLDFFKSNIICITQNSYIFNGSIRDNILLTNNDISEEKLNYILEQVCLIDDINEMERGVDTVIGDKGILLSGGQAQKLALARAFVQNPKVIILDEPTSALDIEAEICICKNIFEYFNDNTVITITHREEILKYCSRIFDIKDRKIHELSQVSI